MHSLNCRCEKKQNKKSFWNKKPDDVDEVDFKIWVELSGKEKKKAMSQNSELNQPEWKLEGRLQLPYKFESLRGAIRRRNKILKKFQLKLEQHEHGQKKRPTICDSRRLQIQACDNCCNSKGIV